jgi:hypothetical protein
MQGEDQMRKLLCWLRLHNYSEKLTIRIKMGDHWFPLEHYKICNGCKKQVRVF